MVYSTPAWIHRISDLLASAAVVIKPGYLPPTMTALAVPVVPGSPLSATQLAMTFLNSPALTCGISSYTSTSPAEVRYCNTTIRSSEGRPGVSRIRRGRANPGNERTGKGTCSRAAASDVSARPCIGLFQFGTGGSSPEPDCAHPLTATTATATMARQARARPPAHRRRGAQPLARIHHSITRAAITYIATDPASVSHDIRMRQGRQAVSPGDPGRCR
jgi:hypothetical protein